MEAPVLELEEVSKTYRGKVEALRGISLQVSKGAVFGLLGPNGAGKSTLVKILTTIIRPTKCRGTMLGQPVGHKPTLKRIGYLPEHARFPSYLTGRQILEYSAGLSGLAPGGIAPKIDELLELVRMKSWEGRKVKTYSKGMKQRIGLAQALVNDPDVLFLDEPTDGVDPEGRRDIRDLIARMREEGRTIFVNTHLLSELEQVADQVAILSKGEVIRVGKLEELALADQGYEIVAASPLSAEVQGALERLGARVAGSEVCRDGADPAAIQPIIDCLRENGVVIQEVRQTRQSLEELFLAAVEQSRSKEAS